MYSFSHSEFSNKYAEIFSLNNNDMDDSEKKKKSPTLSNRYSIVALPPRYPYNIFFSTNKEEIEELMKQFLSGSNHLRIHYDILEIGLWKIVCFDEQTLKKIIEEVATWVYMTPDSTTEYPLKVLPEHLLPKFIQLSCIITRSIDRNEFITSIKFFDSSRWTFDRTEEVDGGTKVYFSVDPASFRFIYFLGLLINIREESVSVSIENNPFAAEFDENFDTED